VGPGLVCAALRFNARNTSYRNIRFNFTGTYFGAMKAYIFWGLLGIVLFFLYPLSHRARDYFHVNHHTYGGRDFSGSYPGWDIYAAYIISWLLSILVILIAGVIAFSLVDLNALLAGLQSLEDNPEQVPPDFFLVFGIIYAAALLAFLVSGTFLRTQTFNLAVDNTQLDKQDWLDAHLNPFAMIWIVFTNLFLILITLGLFYPWVRVRMTKYMATHLTLFARTGLDAFTAEVAADQSAIGEEVAGFFDIDIGL
jgi:uncharacterized membrane protein YjgN (DUF898 family)